MRYKFSNEDIDFLKHHYPIGNWDLIFERFPTLSKSSIQHKMSRLGIPFDKKYSKRNYDYSLRQKWTVQEESILCSMYSNFPIETVMEHLPNRSRSAIILHGQKLGLNSYHRQSQTWSENQIQYILRNWQLEPDTVMAKKLNKSFRSVKWKREQLGIFRRDMDSMTYPNLSKYIRGHIQQWKNDSMKNCNYQCIFTGSKNFEIHHLYGVSNIISDVMNKNPNLYKETFDEYSNDELSFILQKYIEEQNLYPLGVCIRKDIHVLFHRLYGQYYNTPNQWYKFVDDYKKGVYTKLD